MSYRQELDSLALGWQVPEDNIAWFPDLLPEADAAEGKLLGLHCLQEGLGFARPQASNIWQAGGLPAIGGHHVDVSSHL